MVQLSRVLAQFNRSCHITTSTPFAAFSKNLDCLVALAYNIHSDSLRSLSTSRSARTAATCATSLMLLPDSRLLLHLGHSGRHALLSLSLTTAWLLPSALQRVRNYACIREYLLTLIIAPVPECVQLTPAFIATTSLAECPTIKTLTSQGERLPDAVADAWCAEGVVSINVYGPTESTIISTGKSRVHNTDFSS